MNPFKSYWTKPLITTSKLNVRIEYDLGTDLSRRSCGCVLWFMCRIHLSTKQVMIP